MLTTRKIGICIDIHCWECGSSSYCNYGCYSNTKARATKHYKERYCFHLQEFQWKLVRFLYNNCWKLDQFSNGLFNSLCLFFRLRKRGQLIKHLKDLTMLLDDNVLTEEEYQAQKVQILNKMQNWETKEFLLFWYHMYSTHCVLPLITCISNINFISIRRMYR